MDDGSRDEDALLRLGARELAACIRRGEKTASEIVEAHISRIEAVNGRLNAMVVRCFDQARAAAELADRRKRTGEPLGPLHGVPITIKECIDVAGTPSTFGVLARRAAIARSTEPHVERLQKAGAIILGKTNVAQLLLFLETDNPVYGRTQNPWDEARTPGGSSGGEAALIASGGSPFGVGTDIGGSSRNPAACSGIVGFKPSEGRMPDPGRGSVPIGQRAIPSQLGLLARKVEDISLGFEIATGCAAPGAIGANPFDLSSLIVGKMVNDGTFAPCAAAARAVNEAAEALAAGGATVVPFDVPHIEEVVELFFGILAGDGGRGMSRFLAGTKKDPRIAQSLGAVSAKAPVRAALRALLRATGRSKAAELLRIYGRVHTSDYWDRVERILDYRSGFEEALDKGAFRPIDVILSPASALPAPKHGATAELVVMGTYTTLYNVLGYPAGVVPFTRVRPDEETKTPRGRDKMDRTAAESERGSAGLPIGVQVAARHGEDEKALAVLSALQAAAEQRADYPRLPHTRLSGHFAVGG